MKTILGFIFGIWAYLLLLLGLAMSFIIRFFRKSSKSDGEEKKN